MMIMKNIPNLLFGNTNTQFEFENVLLYSTFEI